MLNTQKANLSSFQKTHGDVSRTNSPFFDHLPLIHQFLNKQVSIEVEGLTVHGKLIRYDFGNKEKPHRPSVLILESPSGKTVIRGNWINITEVKSNG